MRVVITGASGFVGQAACAHLESLGHEVIRWVGPKTPADPSSFQIDIADASTFPAIAQIGQVDAVVHCAGIAHRFGRVSSEDFDLVNVRGVENTVLFAERIGARKFVLLSSVLVYGTPQNDAPVNEDSARDPDDTYGFSKLKGEHAAIEMCKAASIGLTILRPAPIVGEGSRGNVSRLIKAIDRGRFFWVGDGRNRRSFAYVSDVARAIGECLDQEGNELSVFNVAGGSVTVAELVRSIETCLGRRNSKAGVPTWLAKSAHYGLGIFSSIPPVHNYRRTLATWLADAVYSGDRIREVLGFVPEVSIEDAIQREVEHYYKTK